MTRDHTDAGLGTAVLAGDADDSGSYTIHGVAIGSGDVTVGSSGVKKVWPDSELREAASTLEGKPLVKDHENSVDGVIGRVTKTTFESGTGVLYEADISEQFGDVAQKIADGLLEVSVRAYHAPTDELEEDDDTGAKRVEDVVFDNLAVVPQGAAPSNSAKAGEAKALSQSRPDLSRAELQEKLDYETDELELHVIKVFGHVGLNEDFLDENSVSDLKDTLESHEALDVVFSEGEHHLAIIVDGEQVDSNDDLDEHVVSALDDTPWEVHDEWSWLDRVNETLSTQDEIDQVVDELTDADPDTDTDELEAAWHTPDWSGTEDSREWSAPDMEDFETDDMSEIDDHFIVSKTGEWPPENYSDLALPVVWPNGDLSLDGLDSAHQMAGQVDGVSDDMADELQSKINGWATEHFDQPVAGEELSDTTDRAQTQTSGPIPVARIADDSSEADKMGMSDSDADTTTSEMNINYHDVDADELEDGHVVVDEEALDAVIEKAERADELDDRLDDMNDTLESLSEQTDVLDEVDSDHLDELQDADDPVIVESEEYETKMDQVDEIGSIFAELLEDAGSPFGADELTERFSPLELKAKYEEQHLEDDDSLVDQLSGSDPEPEGEDVNGEELEEGSGSGSNGDNVTKEEAREYLAAQFEDAGYTTQAEEMRNGDIPVSEYEDELGVSFE